MDADPTATTPVDTTILRKAGLTESQARGYLALIENASLTPVELAEKTGESRTNGYMICEKLTQLGLASPVEGKKLTYVPLHPNALEVLAEKRRRVVQRNEIDVKNGIDPLINLFYAATELPGTRTLQGIDGIKEVFEDTLRADKSIYLIRSNATSLPALGYDFIYNYRERRAAAGIHTHALTPDTSESREHFRNGDDDRLLMERVFLPTDTYTEPVEMDIYDDKVAMINFGDTQISTIIQSRAIADAMRQIFGLVASAYAGYSDDIKQSLLADPAAEPS